MTLEDKPDITPDEFIAASATVHKFVNQWLFRNRGRIVKTPGGKFKGRHGRIAGAHFDERRGNLNVLVMTLTADGDRELNSIGETRAYWPLHMFEDLLL